MNLKNAHGATLIECLISIILLAIVLAGGIGFYSGSSAVMTTAMDKKVALEMATQAMEQIKRDGYASLPNPALGSWEAATPVTFSNKSFSFTAQKQRRVTDIEGTSPNINKRVEIQMSWTQPGNSTLQIITLATYMAP